MNRFYQKSREAALQKELDAVKQENDKLKFDLRVQKDALAMETAAKNGLQAELAKERRMRTELQTAYSEMLRMVDKKDLVEDTFAGQNKDSELMVSVLENADSEIQPSAPRCSQLFAPKLNLRSVGMLPPRSNIVKRKSTAQTRATEEADLSHNLEAIKSETRLKTLRQTRQPNATLNDSVEQLKSPRSPEGMTRRISYFEKLKKLPYSK